MKKLSIITLVAGLLFLAASCGTMKQVATAKNALAHTWVFTKDGKDVMGCNIKKPISIRFSEDKVNGYSGCNSFFGPYKISKNHQIKLGPLGSTMMACVGDECGKVEVGFIRDLDLVNKFKYSDKHLSLFHDDQLLLQFRQAD